MKPLGVFEKAWVYVLYLGSLFKFLIHGDQ